MSIKIIDTDFGISYRYGNIIEINPILKKYPKLYKSTLNHEKQHEPNKKSSLKDLLIDVKYGFEMLFDKDWIKFMIRHPKINLQSALPIWYNKKEWYINSISFVLYGFILLSLALLIKIWR